MYGVAENPKGTPRSDRLEHDLTKATGIVKKICPSISTDPIVDCQRLGSYTESKTRPILVRFARALDATKVMSNRKKLSDIPGISIKPQMSTHELKIESILLKERRSLLNSGTQSKQIKMNTAKGELLVNNTLHGRVNRQTNTFVYTTDLPSHDCDVNTPESDSEPDSQPDVQPDPHHDGASSKN
jgi:hypothetical protein